MTPAGDADPPWGEPGASDQLGSTDTEEIDSAGVVGAGTMGSGIAQVLAQGGCPTVVFDPSEEARNSALTRIRRSLERGAARGKWDSEAIEDALARLTVADRLSDLAACDLVIEAVPERIETKQELFSQLANSGSPDVILATNTSSLSVTSIARPIPQPQRILGMHFFNPAPVMGLVEVVSGIETDPLQAERVRRFVESLGKTPIRARDAIGFVANRCARPFTLEGMRISSELGIDPTEIDRICRMGAGFRMGPFELIDLVGADINLAVAKSFYEQSFGEPRWRPHPTQVSMVAAGRLGQKSDSGFYDHGDGPYRAVDPQLDLERPILDEDVLARVAGPDAPRVLAWISAQIVNEACFALAGEIASETDIDIAMKLGFNWPVGPLEWGRRIGFSRVLATLEELRESQGEAYRPAPLLRKMAAEAA